MQTIPIAIKTGHGHSRIQARVTSDIPAGTNVTGAGGSPNLDFELPSYSGIQFVERSQVWWLGLEQTLAADVAGDGMVYPGDAPATGDLKFKFDLTTDDVIVLRVIVV